MTTESKGHLVIRVHHLPFQFTTPHGEYLLRVNPQNTAEDRKRPETLELVSVNPVVRKFDAMPLAEDPNYDPAKIFTDGFRLLDLERADCGPYWINVLTALYNDPRVVRI